MANNNITEIGVKPTNVTSVDVNQKTTQKKWPNGRVTARREWAEPKYEFELEYNGLSQQQFKLLENHFNQMGGRFGVFDFTDERAYPVALYSVRYNQDDLTRKPVKKEVGFRISVKVKLIGTFLGYLSAYVAPPEVDPPYDPQTMGLKGDLLVRADPTATQDISITVSVDDVTVNAPVTINNTLTANKITVGTQDIVLANANGKIAGSYFALNSVHGSSIVANSLDGTKITPRAITSTLIDTDAITADHISAEAIEADHIASNAITADHLSLSNSTNLWPNTGFSGGKTTDLRVGQGAVVLTRDLPAGVGAINRPYAWLTTINSTSFVKTHKSESRGVEVSEGEEFWLAAKMVRVSGTVSSVIFGLRSDDGDELLSDEQATAVVGTWRQIGGVVFNIPAGWDRCSAFVRITTAGGGQVAVTDFIWRKRHDATLIVDGTIDATKIAAGAVTAAKIAADAISAETLQISNFINLWPNSAFSGGRTTDLRVADTTGAVVLTDTVEGVAGAIGKDYAWKTNTGATSTLTTHVSDAKGVEVSEGDQFLVSARAASITGVVSDLRIKLKLTNKAGTATTLDSGNLVAKLNNRLWTKISYKFTVPANFLRAVAQVSVASSGQAVLTDFGWFKRADGELIVDGSIKANHIDVGAIEADKIAADAITTDHLTITNLTNLWPNPGFAGNKSTNLRLSAGVTTVTTGELYATAGAVDQEYAGKIVGNGSVSTHSADAKGVTVKAGETFLLAAQLARLTAGLTVIKLGLRSPSGAVVESANLVASITSAAWTPLSASLTVPAGWTKAVAYIAVTSTGQTAVTDFTWFKRYDGELIVDGSIKARHIDVGAVTADKITAEAIKAEHLSVTNFTNLWTNPNFTGGNTNGMRVTNGAVVTTASLQAVAGTIDRTYAWKTNNNTTSILTTHSSDNTGIEVNAGDQFVLTAKIASYTGTISALKFGIRTTDSAATIYSADQTSKITNRLWTSVSAIVTIPANFDRAVAFITVTSSGQAAIADLFWRKRYDGSLIVDGAIKAEHIDINSIDATKIQADAITTDHLTVTNTVNLWPNADFDAGKTTNLRVPAAPSTTINTGDVFGTAGAIEQDYAFKIVGNGSISTHSADAKGAAITKDEEYLVSLSACRVTAGLSSFKIGLRSKSGAIMLSSELASLVTATWSKVSASFKIPVGWSKAVAFVQVASTGQTAVTGITWYKRYAAELIVDGSIKANHIEAGSITGDHLEADTTTTKRLYVGDTKLAIDGVSKALIIRDATRERIRIGYNAAAPAGYQYGLWVVNASGSEIFNTEGLADGVIQSRHIQSDLIHTNRIYLGAEQRVILDGRAGQTSVSIRDASRERVRLGYNGSAAAGYQYGIWVWDAAGKSIIDTEGLADAVVESRHIQTDAITTEHIFVGNFTNHWPNPTFEDNKTTNLRTSNGSVVLTSTITGSGAAPAEHAFKANTGTAEVRSFTADTRGITVKRNEQYYLESTVAKISGTITEMRFVLKSAKGSTTGDTVTSANLSSQITNANWTDVSAVLTIPAGWQKAIAYWWVTNATGQTAVTCFTWRKKNDGSLIVDGSIDAQHIKADLVHSKKIYLGALQRLLLDGTANQITVSDATRRRLLLGYDSGSAEYGMWVWNNAGQEIINTSGLSKACLIGDVVSNTVRSSVGTVYNIPFEATSDLLEFQGKSAGETVSLITTGGFASSGCGLFTSNKTNRSANATSPYTGGVYLEIPQTWASQFTGQRVEVTLFAKKPASNAAATVSVCYLTSDGYASNWMTFSLASNWRKFSFKFDVPFDRDNVGSDKLGIWADGTGAGLGALIDNITIKMVTRPAAFVPAGSFIGADNIYHASVGTLPVQVRTGLPSRQVASIVCSASITKSINPLDFVDVIGGEPVTFEVWALGLGTTGTLKMYARYLNLDGSITTSLLVTVNSVDATVWSLVHGDHTAPQAAIGVSFQLSASAGSGTWYISAGRVDASSTARAGSVMVGPTEDAHDGAATTYVPNGLTLTKARTGGGWPTTWGNALRIKGDGCTELYFAWNMSAITGDVYLRTKRDASETAWGSWRKFAMDPDVEATDDTTVVRGGGGVIKAGGTLYVEGVSANVSFIETDQTGAAGKMRFRLNGDVFYFQRNTATDGLYGTNVNIFYVGGDDAVVFSQKPKVGSYAVVLSNDSRLADARPPTTHTHPATGISDSTSIGRSLLTAADAPAARAAMGVAYGSSAGTVCQGNDSRLFDARPPTAHNHSDVSSLEIGASLSDNRNAYIDLHGDDTWTDYSARLIRWNTGVNANTVLYHRGTGNLQLIAQDAGGLSLQTNSIARLSISPSGVITTDQPIQSSITGNAATATKLLTARTITLDGDVTGSALFDGTSNVTITTDLPATGSFSYLYATQNFYFGTGTSIDSLRVGNVADCPAFSGRNLANTGYSANLFKWDQPNQRWAFNDVPYVGNYAVVLSDGTGASGNWNISASRIQLGSTVAAHNGAAATELTDGLALIKAYKNGYPDTYGNVLEIGGLGEGELFLGWKSTTSVGEIWYRSHRDGAVTAWSAWTQVITGACIGTYAPTLTGAGASGTWGISVTGNAATATVLASSRSISLTGAVVGSGSFNGSADLTISTSLAAHNQPASTISDSTSIGRQILTSADATAVRSAIGVAYGSSANTVCQGNDSRLNPYTAGTGVTIAANVVSIGQSVAPSARPTFTELSIVDTAPTVLFHDTDAAGLGQTSRYWIHINSGRFYILKDADNNGSWESPHPVEIDPSTSKVYLFGQVAYHAGNLSIAETATASTVAKRTVDGDLKSTSFTGTTFNGHDGFFDSFESDYLYAIADLTVGGASYLHNTTITGTCSVSGNINFSYAYGAVISLSGTAPTLTFVDTDQGASGAKVSFRYDGNVLRLLADRDNSSTSPVAGWEDPKPLEIDITNATVTVFGNTVLDSDNCKNYASALPNTAVKGDISVTLTIGTHATIQRFTSTLTANRTVTLSTTGAINGSWFRVVRTGGGAFTLSVGGLKTLAQNQWCDVHYDGTTWNLTAFGSL